MQLIDYSNVPFYLTCFWNTLLYKPACNEIPPNTILFDPLDFSVFTRVKKPTYGLAMDFRSWDVSMCYMKEADD